MSILVLTLLIVTGALLLAIVAARVTRKVSVKVRPDPVLVYLVISLIVDLVMLAAAIVWGP